MKKTSIKFIFSWLFLSLSAGAVMAQENNTAGEADQAIDSTRHSINRVGKVHLPFDKTSEYKTTTGSVWVIDPEELMSYDNIQDVSEALYGRIPGMRGTNIREFGEALTIIDGVPRPLSSVTLQEIQQITVLKDINASVLYGVQADNGVILVTTKRGQASRPKISTWVEYGMDKPISYPTFVNAAGYMELYNEARVNDGLPENYYAAADIDATRAGTNSLQYPDVDYFNRTFLKSSRPMARAVADFSGGNENAQYYVNAGFMHSGGLLKLGQGSKEKSNRINLRSNINFRINDFIKSHLDIAAIYDNERSARGDFWGNAASLRPNLFSLLIDTAMVPSPGSTRLINGRYILGGTSQFRDNVYGDLYLGGYNNSLNTTAQFTNGIDFDLRSITEGLSLKVLGSFDFVKRFREYQSNEYAVYELDWDNITDGKPGMEKIGSEQFTGTQSLDNTLIQRSYGFNGVLNYARTFGGKHAVSASAVAFMNRVRQTHPNNLYDDKYSHLGFNVNYAYDSKYVIDFSSALVHSVKLPEANRNGFSPSLALGWVVSNEDFLENSSALDFLKVKASAGIMNTDMAVSQVYLYQDLFANSGSYGWDDGVRGNQRTVFQNVGNNDLSFEKKLDLNIGIEAGLLDESLWLDVNVFRNHYADQILQQTVNYNDYLGGFVPFSNYGKDQYSGVEVGALWSGSSNDLRFDIGINASYIKTKVIQTNEIFENDYQYRKGNPVNAIYGLKALGLFESDADITSHATQMFGEVKPGDIKYADQNGDGMVDDNDQIMIGEGTPTLSGGLNLRVGYKNFSLFAIATAVQGSDRMYNSEYYWVYGDRKYSEEVLNRWTPQTASTATYPRLTSQASPNNFRSSSYWLHDNSRVSLNRVQLSYGFPKSFGSALGISDLSVYVRGSNLLTLSENSERMELNVGSLPQFRTYSVGLKATFF